MGKMAKPYFVMIVEDEEVFSDYIEQFLQGQGYKTATFGEPFKALDYFINHAEQVDLILTDIVMPYMDGIELAKRAARVRRETPVILISAYSEQLIDGAALPNVKVVLDKPILRTDLMQAVETVLPSRGNRRGVRPS